MTKICPEHLEIIEFSKENLINILTIYPEFPINEKKQVIYLFNYLDDLECKCMILEEIYIDKYYLDDYLHFYATCHIDYPKECKRLHFFSKKINESDFYEKEKIEELNSIYQGFLIIKQIPNIVIGRTSIKTYMDTNHNLDLGSDVSKKRHILTLKHNSAHFLGLSLSFQSIVFQEQDNVISACATTALWTVLEKVCSDYGYYSPSPFEIRNSASNSFALFRSLPASGLNLLQVIKAIRDYNLEVEMIDYTNNKPSYEKDNFISLCYAYLRGGVPIFLGVQIEQDYHALAILGYHLRETQESTQEIPFYGNRIDKLYIHDDNIGPFTRYYINTDGENSIILECEDRKKGGDFIPINIKNVVIPLYHKNRYPFSEIQIIINEFHKFIKESEILEEGFANEMEWDCYITSTNQYKSEWAHNPLYQKVDLIIKKDLLKEHLPRFIWRCCLRLNGLPLLDLLADATGAKINSPFFYLH